MTKNQEWFNKEYPKEIKKIKFEDEVFKGLLIVENYPSLEKLYLQNVKNIDRVILKNLPQLQECTIWDCGVQDLLIENCSQIKKLNVRKNLLTNLEFLANLKKLEKLEIDYNKEISSDLEYLPKSLEIFSYEGTQLVELLKPYQGDWKKAYRIVELARKRPRELLETISDLREQNKRLKKEVEEYNNSPQPMIIDDSVDFKQKYQKLKETINSLLKEEKEKSDEIKPLEKTVSTEIVTDELIEKLKEQKENLSYLEKTNQDLKEKFTPFEQVYWKIEKKEKDLKELKNEIIAKNHLKDEEDLDELSELLEKQKIATKNDNEESAKKLEFAKKRMLKTKIVSEAEINDLLYIQSQIVKLQTNFNQREEQISQVVNNYNIAGNAIINSTVGDHADFKTITYQSAVSSSNQAIAGSSSQKAQIEQKPNKWLSWRDKP